MPPHHSIPLSIQVSAIAHRHTMHCNTRTPVQTPTRSEAGRAIAPRSSSKSMRESHLHASENGSPARILSPAMECGTRSRGPATPTSSAASANAAVFSPGGSIRATYARSSAPATPRSTRGEMAQAVNESSSALSSRLSQVESQLQRAFIPSTAAEVLSAQRARRELCLPDYMHTRITAAPALTE